MPAIRAPLAALLIGLAAPALAVGLGPLTKEGMTDGPRKGFYLTVINPYPTAETFRAYAVGFEDEEIQPRVHILPGESVRVGGKQSRRILVVADDLEPGETYAFRVCATKVEAMEGMIHARVCSKLSARRIVPNA